MLPVLTFQAALGLGGSNNGAATAGQSGSTIPVGDPTAADGGSWGAAKKRMAVAADNQDATNITSYAKPDFVKQLIRKCGYDTAVTAFCASAAVAICYCPLDH